MTWQTKWRWQWQWQRQYPAILHPSPSHGAIYWGGKKWSEDMTLQTKRRWQGRWLKKDDDIARHPSHCHGAFHWRGIFFQWDIKVMRRHDLTDEKTMSMTKERRWQRQRQWQCPASVSLLWILSCIIAISIDYSIQELAATPFVAVPL